MTIPHQPIMVEEILDALQPAAGGIYIDGTLGAGGHSLALLEREPQAHILGIDRDPHAINIAAERLQGHTATIVHGSYREMAELLKTSFDVSQADGILLDLGVSSMQLDQAERGFAFRFDAPLDMRFDPSSNQATAADLVNELPADALANIFYKYGEEKNSRKIAKAIVAARPLYTTTELAQLIASVSRSKEKIHPATRSFQALRIAVNQELDIVENSLPIAIDVLKTGARFAVLTFHSLEDRIVKRYFKHEATDCICPPRQPICTCKHKAKIRLINRKPLTASEDEIQRNPRARSAKLRIVERL